MSGCEDVNVRANFILFCFGIQKVWKKTTTIEHPYSKLVHCYKSKLNEAEKSPLQAP